VGPGSRDDLGEENPGTNMLVVPAESVVRLISPKGLTVDRDVVEVARVFGRFV
jgi:hypothetical protein